MLNKTRLFTEEVELNLYYYFKLFRPYGSTYMYFTINDPSIGRLRFSTNENWIKEYLRNFSLVHDPIKKICDQKISRIVCWKNIMIAGREQKKIMEARCSFGLYNGVSIINHNSTNGLQKVLTLCTDSKSHNLSHELLNNELFFKETAAKIFALV